MTSRSLSFANTEKPRQIQENMIAYMRLFAGLPGMAMVDADVFWFVSGDRAPGNQILRATWPEEGVEARIDGLFADIGRRVDAIDWMVFPGDTPADLNQRLEARGMPGTPGGNWLWADLTSLGDAPKVPAEFHIEQVRDDAMMADWTRISEAGFEANVDCFYDAYARHGYGRDAFSIHYIGYLHDVPITSGTLLDAGGTASIYDVSTPADYRRQGYGGAITHALMCEIRALGYADTWIWSSELGKGVYEGLGYVTADFGMREHEWKKG